MTTTNALRKPTAVWLSVIAGLFYCSWPLGFILNPSAARHSLVSKLEASGQPFNWVFIGVDVLAGATVLLLGYWFTTRGKLAKGDAVIGASLATFGFLVGLAALLPIDCDPSVSACGSLLRHPILIAHGFTSIASVVGLLVALLLTTYNAQILHARLSLRLVLYSLIVAWSVFGIASLIEIALRMHSNISQYYFISVCSLSIPAIVVTYDVLTKPRRPRRAR